MQSRKIVRKIYSTTNNYIYSQVFLLYFRKQIFIIHLNYRVNFRNFGKEFTRLPSSAKILRTDDLTQFWFFVQTTFEFHLSLFEVRFEIEVAGTENA